MAQMDDNTTPKAEPRDDDRVLRQRLLKRVGLAAGVVLLLLAVLMLFDGTATREKPDRQVARIEPPTRVIDKQAAEEKAAEQAAEKVAEKPAESVEPVKEVVAEPERTEAPTIALRSRPERPLTVPATARPAMMRPEESPLAARKVEPVKEIARVSPAPTTQIAQPTIASRPIARAVEATRQFMLQVGVFNNLANAEELRARLEKAGVPAHIEARVQAGPFASRQEIERARERLKSLGIDPGLVVAGRK
jgi:DedD protein